MGKVTKSLSIAFYFLNDILRCLFGVMNKNHSQFFEYRFRVAGEQERAKEISG